MPGRRHRRRDRGDSTGYHSRFRGWVYVMDNEAMPKVVKVGFTLDDPVNRAWELRSTGNPYAYIVRYHALVDNPRGLEQAVHKKLDQFREEGEWFGVSLVQAIAAIRYSAVRILFEDESPRWHPRQPTPSEASRAKLQREQERLERESREREAADRRRRSHEKLAQERAERERLQREATERERRERERAEHERQERARTARSKGDDCRRAVKLTAAQAKVGCVLTGRSACGLPLDVKCPPGMADGRKLRLREQGHQSKDGGPPGDMIILVRVLG